MQPLVFLQRHAIYWLFIFVILFACCYSGQAQANPEADRKVTLSATQISLKDVFKAIRKQTGLAVFFSNYTTDIQLKEKVNVNFDKTPLDEVMRFLLRDKKNHSFRFSNDAVIIFKEDVTPKSFSPQKDIVDTTATSFSLTGKITDAGGQPISGATVIVKGTTDGTTTDAEGNFSLPKVKSDAKLLISSIGFETMQIPAKSKSLLVQMKLVISELDETIVIAYGSTTKRYNTGNIASVKANDIEKQPVNNPLLALQGRVPGLFITQANGISGGAVTVRIQGKNSIAKGNDPLYVVDGVAVLSQLPATGLDGILGSSGGGFGFPNDGGTGSPFSYINPLDIESIEVLKDADATAIYGSRAANGAILITTKKGKAGKTKVNINLQQGWGKVTRKLPMLNKRQYLDMRYEAYKNDGVDVSTLTPDASNSDLTLWDTTRSTDWQKVLIGNTAKYTNANATISGGTPLLQYLFGATYHRETTVFPLPDDFADNKGSVHLSLTSASANQKFHFQLSSTYATDNNQLPRFDLTQMAIPLEPVAPALYNADGTLNWAPDGSGRSTFINPLAAKYNRYENKTTNFINNAVFDYLLFPGLQLKTSIGYNIMQTNDYSAYPLIGVRPERRPSTERSAAYGNRNLNSWIVEPQITYNKDIWKGKLNALLGATIQQNSNSSHYISASGFNSDDILEDIAAATAIFPGINYITKYKYAALFGRLNYIWLNKYIFNLSARRDGSSRFGPSNRFHNFWSIAAGWVFSEEPIVKSNFPFLSFGKFRASYGTTGNDQIGDYQFLNLYRNPIFGDGPAYQGVPALYPVNLPNPYFEWEQTNKLQGGIDLGLMQDRILLNVTYARNRSSNQLLSYNLPSITGFLDIVRNFPATVQNTSWEFSLQTVNVKSERFSWTSNINLTIPRNKLIGFPNLSNSSYAYDLKVGQPLNTIFTYHSIGVNPATGEYQFADSHGSPTTEPTFPDDYNKYINTQVKMYGGFQNQISYRGLQIDFLFQYVNQPGTLLFFNNLYVPPGSFRRGVSNQPITVLNRWQKPGDMAAIQKYGTSTSNSGIDYIVGSDAGYGDASYIRLKNVSVSLELPGSWKRTMHFQQCRIYLQGQNLWTITNYQGLDPENQSINSLPPLRVLTVGAQFGF